MFNRDHGFSLEIKDPSNPDLVDPINTSIVIDNESYIIKERSIYRIRTANKIDPEREYPDTKHSYEKVYSIGSTSPYIARMLLQFEPIIKFLKLSEEEHDKFLSYLWQINKYLLSAYKIETSILSQTIELMTLCDKIIEDNKEKQTIPALPQIPELEANVRTFLNNGKLYLIESFKLLTIFYKMPSSDLKSARFSSHLTWARKYLGEDHRVSRLLAADLEWIRFISECRNALEHPQAGQLLKLRNIALQPGNKFSLPSWSYDLTNKLSIESGYVDLCTDLETFLHNMLCFFEEFLLVCVEDKLSGDTPFEIIRIPENSVNPKCPIKYIMSIKEKFGRMNESSAEATTEA